MGTAIKGRVYADRLKILMGSASRDEALEKLFEEEFNKKPGPRTPQLWTQTWNEVVNSLALFWGDGHGLPNIKDLADWLKGRQAAYRNRAPAPPRPKVPPRLGKGLY